MTVKKRISTATLYSIFNGIIIVGVIIATKFTTYDLFYVSIAVALLAGINITILITQLKERERLYEEARLKAQRLSFLEQEILRFRQHRHDIKNHLVVIRELANMQKLDDLKNYTEKLTDSTSQALIECHTGISEVDVLLYTKKNEADVQGIIFNINVQAAMAVDKKYTLDIVSIIANLLDNALEATARIEVSAERFVQVRLFDDILANYIIVTNSFSPKYAINPEQAFVKRFTTKANPYNHGLGLTIVKKLVRRHGGQIKLDIFNGVFFQIKVELPKHRLKDV